MTILQNYEYVIGIGWQLLKIAGIAKKCAGHTLSHGRYVANVTLSSSKVAPKGGDLVSLGLRSEAVRAVRAIKSGPQNQLHPGPHLIPSNRIKMVRVRGGYFLNHNKSCPHSATSIFLVLQLCQRI
jgi:hypothetical protein